MKQSDRGDSRWLSHGTKYGITFNQAVRIYPSDIPQPKPDYISAPQSEPHAVISRGNEPIALFDSAPLRNAYLHRFYKEEKTMTVDSAEGTVSRIEQSIKKDGAANAAHMLSKEFADYASSHDASQTNAYWNKVSAQLNQDKVLTDLAIVWAKDKRGELSRDGDLTQFDLKAVNRWSDGTALDRTMAKSLLDNFENLRKEHADTVGQTLGMFGGSEKNAITPDDVQTRIDRVEKARVERNEHERQVNESRDLMKALVATKDGNPAHSLLQTLDILRGGNPDGRVSADDLKRYLEEYKVRETTGEDLNGEKFNAKNKAFVEKLLKDWNSPAVNRLKDGDAITAESLVHAGDFKDKSQMAQSFRVQM